MSSNLIGGTEAVVKWLNTAEESESATMDEPTILTSARRCKSRRFESCLLMQYGSGGREVQAPDCGSGDESPYAGSNPALPPKNGRVPKMVKGGDC